MTNKQILVILNPIGFKISSNDIVKILNPKSDDDTNIREHVEHFFQNGTVQLTENLLSRYAQACEIMSNISISSIHEDLWSNLINTLASAKRCFSYREDLACIELCALHAEKLANYLCIVNEAFDTHTRKIEHFQNNFNAMYQRDRIEHLKTNNVVSKDEGNDLVKIHELRIKYFHHWNQQFNEIDTDVLTMLEKTSKISSKFLELLNRDNNIKKIEIYLDYFENL